MRVGLFEEPNGVIVDSAPCLQRRQALGTAGTAGERLDQLAHLVCGPLNDILTDRHARDALHDVELMNQPVDEQELL